MVKIHTYYLTNSVSHYGLTEYYVKHANKGEVYEPNQHFYHPDHASTPLSTGLGSSSFITNAIGYAEQHPIAIGVQYLPFGELFVNQQNSTYDTRYKFSAKLKRSGNPATAGEKDNETQYSYFGARYGACPAKGGDSDLSVWLSVDPMADKYPSMSPYMYVGGNPVMITDPNGMDWFVDEETGDVHYNSRLGKDDAAQVGKNYKWLGKNDMFGYNEEEMRAAAYDKDGIIGQMADEVKTYTYYNENGSTLTDEAHFSGENAEKFMGAMGYEKAITQGVEYTRVFNETDHSRCGSRTADITNSHIIIAERYSYVKRGLVPTSHSMGQTMGEPQLNNILTVGRYRYTYAEPKNRASDHWLYKFASSDFSDDIGLRVINGWSNYSYNIGIINRFVKRYGTR
ncbi:MAG: hypothetical protein JXR53_12275 [Bacteroidales bacterium]|nr:hypothetical protein [Bacteroidales bacterium]